MLTKREIPRIFSPRCKKLHSIREKKEQYSTSFAIHGLTRCIKTAKIEFIFWSSLLIIAVITSSVVVYRLAIKYRRHAVYMELQLQITDRNYFPSVTFCEEELFKDSYYAYCGESLEYLRRNESNNGKHCVHYKTNKKAHIDQHEEYWTSGLFNFTRCATHTGKWSGKRHGKHCNNNSYLKPLQQFNNSCVSWNYKGDFYDAFSHVDITFKISKPGYATQHASVFAIIHDPEIKELEMTNKISMSAHINYDVSIDKTFVKRLPAPYPSNCDNNLKKNDIFPGKYSKHACVEMKYYIGMYKQCGDVYDYMRRYIPPDTKFKYKRNITIQEFLECARDVEENGRRSSFDCRTSCEDLELNVVSYSNFNTLENNISFQENNDFSMSIHFQVHDAYKIMEEKELYSWYQMLCGVGGFIGLVMGMSILSLVEIVAYACLATISKFLKVDNPTV